MGVDEHRDNGFSKRQALTIYKVSHFLERV